MVMKDELPAMLIILILVILAVGYSAYKAMSPRPDYNLCPLCNQKVTVKI